MAPIKASMGKILPNVKVLDTTFCIQFLVGSQSVMSDPFKLVSSCSQLPENISRDDVRPTKREKKVGKSSKSNKSNEDQDGQEAEDED